MLKGNMSCKEIRKVSIWDGEVKVVHDGVGEHPCMRKLMGKACVGTSEGK